MSRMARRHQSAIEEPEPTSQQPPQTPAAQAHSDASAAPSVFTSSPQVTGDTRPTRRSRKQLRTAQAFEDPEQTRENPAVQSPALPQAHRPEGHSELHHDQHVYLTTTHHPQPPNLIYTIPKGLAALRISSLPLSKID